MLKTSCYLASYMVHILPINDMKAYHTRAHTHTHTHSLSLSLCISHLAEHSKGSLNKTPIADDRWLMKSIDRFRARMTAKNELKHHQAVSLTTNSQRIHVRCTYQFQQTVAQSPTAAALLQRVIARVQPVAAVIARFETVARFQTNDCLQLLCCQMTCSKTDRCRSSKEV
jgi:hypothetical protein